MPLNRKELVRQQNPKSDSYDPDSFLSVGNGNFAYTVDCTGLQTILHEREGKTPLCTMSTWGMHCYPGKEVPHYEQLKLKQYQAGGRTVGYMSDSKGQEALFNDLRVNPHRFNLAHIGLYSPQGIAAGDLSAVSQELDLYQGVIASTFTFHTERVQVTTFCDPHQDQLGFSISSPLFRTKQLALKLSFPYASHLISGADYTKADAHQSRVDALSPTTCTLVHSMDATTYSLGCASEEPFSLEAVGNHTYLLYPNEETLTLCIRFSAGEKTEQPTKYAQSLEATRSHWASFWEEGGFIDISQSSDSRAQELQRRMLLSRYLLAIQCSGNTPPPETGLTCNSWYGKFHLEMHLLHAAHFCLFGQSSLFERSLAYYLNILPSAIKRARQQGYRGARWPKMTDASGNDSPSSIGTLLIWQQPHPVFYASLLDKTKPDSPLLAAWKPIIEETLTFMADYVLWDEQRKVYVLGPPVIPVQENHDAETTLNPSFELSYFRWAFAEGIRLFRKLGGEPDPVWEEVENHLAPLPVGQGRYLAQEHCPDTYGAYAYDHPSLLFNLSLLGMQGIDTALMEASLEGVMKHWKLEELWGWDFPLMAMCAARLGKPELAIDLLLADSPKNTYTHNGHNAQLPKADLPLYLPGNGALLLALALMAGGWEGSLGNAPGFPKEGWVVRSEGLKKFW